MIRKRAIIIGKDGIHESKNVKVYRDFITVDGIPYPKPKPHFRQKTFFVEVVYVINESALTREQLEKIDYLERLVKKKELESVVNAIISISTRARMQIISYVLMGVFAGAYLSEYGRQILEWLRSLPPEVALKGFETLQIVAIGAIIAAIAYIFMRKR